MKDRYGIAEWYGESFADMSSARRREFAAVALGHGDIISRCPFQHGNVKCGKKGGVCSIQTYRPRSGHQQTDRIEELSGKPVITCPKRFDQDDIVPKWLGEIVGFQQIFLAQEVPFMRSPSTGRSAGRIDLVLSENSAASKWFGLEIQAVYFSGEGMTDDFRLLLHDAERLPPMPTSVRRPDWRSSSAKRLMPQLEVKAPTLRRWGTKLAVAVDVPFFDAVGGQSEPASHDINEGDIIWLVLQVSDEYKLETMHWEVLSLEDSSEKLLAAKTVRRKEFEEALRSRLRPLQNH